MLGRMDSVLLLREAVGFEQVELQRVELLFRIEASARPRLRLSR